MMTEEEEAVLRALGEELEEARRSPWQPRAVGSVFRRDGRPRLTMQGWIDLDWVKSPLLEGGFPESTEEIAEAFRAFGEEWNVETPEETLGRLHAMRAAVKEAFAAMMPMTPPSEEGLETEDNGMGHWLPMLACLVGEMRMPPTAALALPVGQALALIAGMRANQGWRPRGETYRDREV